MYCVPGNVTSSTSRGTNRLIKDGAAAMMTCAEDVWQNYSSAPLVRPAVQSPARTEDPEERRLLLALKEPKRADELIAAGLTALNIADLQAKLSFLEIKGLIRQLPGKYYQTVIRSIRA